MGRMASRHGGAGLGLIAGLAVLSAVLALAGMLLLRHTVARLVRGRTGFDGTMRSFYLNPVTGRLRVDGLMITNPPDHPQKDFLEIPELGIDARPGSLFGRTWKIDDAVADLSAVTLVRNARGDINARRCEEGRSGPASPGKGNGAEPDHSFWIGRLAQQVDCVAIADFNEGRPLVRTFDVHLDHRYTIISGMQGLAAPVAAIMARTGKAGQDALPQAGSLLRVAGKELQKAGHKSDAVVKGLLESLEKRLRNWLTCRFR